MNVKQQTLFLIDAIGACISTISLGYFLIVFNEYIGMSTDILYLLAAIAAIFGIYSSFCFIIHPKNSKTFLRLIGIGNLLYSILTSGLVVRFWDSLELFGVIYFIGEILILWVISVLEIQKSLQ